MARGAALRLLVDRLFGAYGLSRLELDTWSVLLDGKRYDSVLVGMLREKWANPA